MKKLILVGGGGHCKSIIDTLTRLNCYDEIVITEKNLSLGSTVLGVRVAGEDDLLPKLFDEGFKEAFVSVGSIKDVAIRHRLYNRVKEIGFKIPNIVDPSAYVSEYVKMGEGIFVGKNSIINADCCIGDMAIINTKALIEHECRVGAFTHVAVNATVCGNCEVGKDVFVGAGSTIIQDRKIGERSVIGAGSVILSDVPSDTRALGIWK